MTTPSNPQITVTGASQDEAAAAIAAIEQFIADAAPAGAAAEPAPLQSAWKRAALLEGVSRQNDQ